MESPVEKTDENYIKDCFFKIRFFVPPNQKRALWKFVIPFTKSKAITLVLLLLSSHNKQKSL